MPDNPTEFNFRHEELAPVAKLLRGHYALDEAEFEELLPKVYNADFLPEYDRRLEAVNKLVSARARQGQSSAIGQRIQEKGQQLPGLLNRLEARARRAKGLTVPWKQLGIKETRDAYASEDLEALDTALKDLLSNVADNADALDEQGQTAAETGKIRTLHQELMDDSATQDLTQTTSQRLTAANVTVYNDLWKLMQEMMRDGRSLYRGVNKAKLKGYTLPELLKRVRNKKGE